jgi:hypothetical protein
MEKLIALGIVLVGSYFLFIGPLLYLYSSKKAEQNLFDEEFIKFNRHRFNPLSKEFYKSLHDYTFAYPMVALSRGEIGGGNQRDGDELMTNPSRDPKVRITDHQDFNHFKRGSTIIHGLGYTFTKKANFEAFVKLFLETMPEGAICLPINKTWAVFIKRPDGMVNLSYDQSILTNNDYRYLTME